VRRRGAARIAAGVIGEAVAVVVFAVAALRAVRAIGAVVNFGILVRREAARIVWIIREAIAVVVDAVHALRQIALRAFGIDAVAASRLVGLLLRRSAGRDHENATSETEPHRMPSVTKCRFLVN